MDVIVRVKVRQRQRRRLLRHGHGEKNELEMRAGFLWVMDRRLKKSHVLCVAPRTLKRQMASFSRLQVSRFGALRQYYYWFDNKDTLGGEGGSCAKRRSTQRSFEIEILLLPSLPSFVIF